DSEQGLFLRELVLWEVFQCSSQRLPPLMPPQTQSGNYFGRLTAPYRRDTCPAPAGHLADFSSSGSACRWIRAFPGKPCRYAPIATMKQWRQCSKVRVMSPISEITLESLKRR